MAHTPVNKIDGPQPEPLIPIEIDLRLSLVGRTQFWSHRALYSILNVLTWPADHVGRLLLFPWRARREGVEGQYQIHTDRRLQRWALKTVLWIIRAANWVSGFQPSDKIYSVLLGWDRSVPILGFTTGKTRMTVKTLGPKQEDGSSCFDLLWFTPNKATGELRVVKTSHDGERVSVQCVWMTGSQAGKVFNVGPNHATLPKDSEILTGLCASTGPVRLIAQLGVPLLASALAVEALAAIRTALGGLLHLVAGVLVRTTLH